MIAMIVCMSQNHIIGKDGVMPWHNQEELQYFKETTMGQHLLMGRTTYEHLPKALDGRMVSVLTSQDNISTKEKVTLYHSLEAVLQKWINNDEVLFVAGGSSVYEQFLPYAKQLYISILKEEYDGDRSFPKWDDEAFICITHKSFQTFDAYILEKIS